VCVNSGFTTVVIFMKNGSLEELLEACILHFLSVDVMIWFEYAKRSL
jgi:hypothetical protein